MYSLYAFRYQQFLILTFSAYLSQILNQANNNKSLIDYPILGLGNLNVAYSVD